MDEARVRYFCHVDPPRAGGFLSPLSDAGYEYLCALAGLESEYPNVWARIWALLGSLLWWCPAPPATSPVRAISIGTADLTAVRWTGVAHLFARPMADANYINVVCGGNGDFGRLHTARVPNVAIVTVPPKLDADELKALTRFDLVICTARANVDLLRVAGVPDARFVPPDTRELGAHLRRLHYPC